MLIAHVSSLAAAAAADPAFVGQSALFIVAVILPVLVFIVAVVGLILSNRRKPPIAEEMHKEFVRRQEWNESVLRLHDRIDETGIKVDNVQVTLHRQQLDAERARGRMEGKLDVLVKAFIKNPPAEED
jgi:hypothetical protein